MSQCAAASRVASRSRKESSVCRGWWAGNVRSAAILPDEDPVILRRETGSRWGAKKASEQPCPLANRPSGHRAFAVLRRRRAKTTSDRFGVSQFTIRATDVGAKWTLMESSWFAAVLVSALRA